MAMKSVAIALFVVAIAGVAHADSNVHRAPGVMTRVDGATFESVLPVAPGKTKATVKSFRLDITPVSNADFALFLQSHPEWRRDRVAQLFADDAYLAHWSTVTASGEAIARQPVTQVSWYAARAYCKSRKARLPTWYEWEWVAAASATTADARQDDAWRQQMLDWYAKPSGKLANVGSTAANLYGVRDLHGVVWEWVEDFNGMVVSGDSRSQSGSDTTQFCGSGALSMEQKDQYAILMRIAMLSSLQAKYTTASLGFRCATDDVSTSK